MGETFTDRIEETRKLTANLTHGINTMIISPRRMGKTSLVEKVLSGVDRNNFCIVRMDAFKCRSERDFAEAFAAAVIKGTSNKLDELMSNAKKFLSHFVPKFSFGQDPINDISLTFDYIEHSSPVEEILDLPEKIASEKRMHVIISIDEFQQIGEFQDSLSFQKKLRSIWQHHQNVTYCLYGSKKHMMEQIFMHESYPFYRFGDIMYLKKINREDWIPFICQRFEATGKHISETLASLVCDKTECYSSYVQHLAWLVWINTETESTHDVVEQSVEGLLDAYESLFIQQTESLTEYQMNFLHAITDGVHQGFSQAALCKKYHLGSSANIIRLKKSLKEKDLIDSTRPNWIEMSDPILALWLKRRIWNSI